MDIEVVERIAQTSFDLRYELIQQSDLSTEDKDFLIMAYGVLMELWIAYMLSKEKYARKIYMRMMDRFDYHMKILFTEA